MVTGKQQWPSVQIISLENSWNSHEYCWRLELLSSKELVSALGAVPEGNVLIQWDLEAQIKHGQSISPVPSETRAEQSSQSWGLGVGLGTAHCCVPQPGMHILQGSGP